MVFKKGHVVSAEIRKKISQANKGRLLGEKNPFYGRKHSEESRKKMSESLKGRPAWNKGLGREEHPLAALEDIENIQDF